MEFVNYTPFSPFVFQSEDVEQRPFDVVVLRGTFAIDDGRPLRPLPEQEPVVRADRYRGELHRSSLLVESDLAPFKPCSDIHIEAVAHAPGGVRCRAGRWVFGSDRSTSPCGSPAPGAFAMPVDGGP